MSNTGCASTNSHWETMYYVDTDNTAHSKHSGMSLSGKLR